MRVLSLSQPWLWSIDTYKGPIPKRIENRTWPCPPELIGEPIALHAAHSWDANAIAHFIKHGIDHPQRRELYAKGAITSVGTVSTVIDMGSGDVAMQIATRRLEDQMRWMFGPFAWVLVDVRRLTTPIPWRGAQGLRHLPPTTTAVIERQLETA